MDLTSLREIRSPEGSIISLYVNRPVGGASAALADLLKPLRAAADALPRGTAKLVHRECDRIQGLVPKIDASIAPAHVIVDAIGGPFVHEPLDQSIWETAHLGPHPYLRPLRAIPEPIRTLIAVADRRRTRVYIAENGAVEPAGPVIEADLGKTNFGGFSGYEEYGTRRRSEQETTRMLKRAAALLLDLFRDERADALLIGGHQETLDELTPFLHSYLQALPMGRAVMDPHTLTLPILRQRADELAVEVRGERDEKAGAAVVEAVERGSGTAGTAPVLEAANSRAIETLVVSGRFEKPGVVCGGCGWMARTGTECPVCGSAASDVDDVIGYLVEAVLDAGGTARHLGRAGPVDRHGVAASLRFPV